jgi:ferredoxin
MRYLERVVTLEFDPAKCNGCGMCALVCPHAVFTMANGTAGTAVAGGAAMGGGAALARGEAPEKPRKRAILADRGACMECGACAINCEPQAIKVRSGVGCAAGVLAGMLAGTEPTCGCSQDGGAKCC